jgi:DNA (cytosine-5)-methyltransferase 1
MKFGSLFSGLGGMDLGLERAGLTCRWQVESGEYARRVLERHWPGLPRYPDVREFPPRVRDPMRQFGVDLICGGDPCQENSRARIGSGLTQSSLGGELLGIVDALRPRLVLREDPSQARRDAPWPWWRFRSELESLGYVVLPFRMRACCVGLDHRRERLFLLACLPDPDGLAVRLQGCLEDAGEAGAVQGEASEREWIRPEPGAALRGPWDRPDTRALRAIDGVPRGLVAARMKAVGNAVPPPVAERIGRAIMKAWED